MTRLKEGDIEAIAGDLGKYDARLKAMTGSSLRQIACNAAGVDEAQMVDVMNQVRIAAVPVTTGLGVIGGFSSTVAAITAHLGFGTFVTRNSDVAGIEEGLERGADVLMHADDHSFVAITPGQRQPVDNSRATAQGFVAALELMNGAFTHDEVLVLGCGPVGVAAAEALLDRGASVALCDKDRERAVAALEKLGSEASHKIRTEDALHPAVHRFDLIFDATNEGSFIEASHLTLRSLVAAPGMPCAPTPEAMEVHRDRILHDALEIGTATMAVQAAATLVDGVKTGKAPQE